MGGDGDTDRRTDRDTRTQKHTKHNRAHPARAALSLVLDGGDSAVLAPVLLASQSGDVLGHGGHGLPALGDAGEVDGLELLGGQIRELVDTHGPEHEGKKTQVDENAENDEEPRPNSEKRTKPHAKPWKTEKQPKKDKETDQLWLPLLCSTMLK